ncbi:exonuclease domain-containing protein [Amycolatopsis carbonis]|uniref:Exonuclease domain-containing protein n=1 Tax=Amycolatopsis carbonis TaxID=715471 RepID=A0A9Y2MZ40_9PSEU|nr:exonuclease domain-containing protein [Amycolatopsis sp. 2-15]WIX80547.1 exonuclease domain-containing protein [Amycolatopsis sp. 2-15]
MVDLIEFLPLTRSGRLSGRGVDFTAIDVKTTGLRTGRIVELGAVRVRGDGVVLGELATLIDPGRSLPASWSGPHRITAGDLAGAPSFADVLGPLLDLCRGAVVVAHDLPLVQGFLAEEVARVGVRLPALPGVSTAIAAQEALRLPNYRLATIARALGIGDFAPYLASASARACAQVVSALVGTHGLRFAAPPRYPELPRYAPGGRILRRPDVEVAERGWMSGVVDRVVTSPSTADSAGAAYLDLLAEAVADEYLSGEEVWALAGLAAEAGLPEPDVRHIHAEFVSALRAVAEADGVVTVDEDRALRQVATALDVPGVLADLRPTTTDRKAPRVLVLGTTAEADQLRARVLDEGVQLAKKLTATVTHLAYDASVPPTEPRLTRAADLGAEVVDVATAPVALGFDRPPSTPSPTHEVPAPPAARYEPAPDWPVEEDSFAAPPQPTRQFAPALPSVPAHSAPKPAGRLSAVVGGRAMMAVGLLLMLITVISLFGGLALGGGFFFGVLGVGLLVGGWYVTETGKAATAA